jgi:hypothetical protein
MAEKEAFKRHGHIISLDLTKGFLPAAGAQNFAYFWKLKG